MILLLSSVSGRVFAHDFTIQSQNFLHLGWGTNTSEKCDAIEEIMDDVDVLIIQELMQRKDPCRRITKDLNLKFESYGPFGNSYKEYYGFYWRNGALTSGKGYSLEDGNRYFTSRSKKFIRQPTATLLKVKRPKGQDDYYVWIANIHSVFGDRVKERQDEAIAFESYFRSLRLEKIRSVRPTDVDDGWPVIVGGDWNIPVTNNYKKRVYNRGFKWLGTNPSADAVPLRNLTSLTKTGAPSSPYDHFLFSTTALGTTLDLDYLGEFPVGKSARKAWRRDVSDHLGIRAEVTLQ
ncbi:deoxyribonuclease [Marinobacter sp.]|uniref:deoxyribonuclease n=1 Tax=Gammaproteobacteria TaxID=1236 RepID=UPI003A95A0DC